MVSSLDLPDQVRHRALALATVAAEHGLANGRSPAGSPPPVCTWQLAKKPRP